MSVPYWVQDAVFYQIFPDRFANGDPSNDPLNVQPWGSPPTPWGFQGGDLRGIIEKMDYLLDLGVNALYLNPIFLANSTHRYDTVDYLQIDPRLGDLEDLKILLKVAHEHGVRVILDGVFNHCGRGFFAFVDIQENQLHSPYYDWFHIKRFPLDAYSPGNAENYLGWWSLKSLPKFNTDHKPVREYLLKVARYWIEQGIDGWRLDVPNEIDDDDFWGEFRNVVKSYNRDAFILGEIWTADPRWVGPRHFDGLMNYPVKEAILGLMNGGDLTITAFADRVEGLLQLYPRENAYAMYVPLGSHDTERILSALGGNLDKTKSAFAFLFAYPGAPAIYYGDEIGLKGGKDPECRGAFPWDPEGWVEELRAWVKSLISWRKRLAVLRRGEYQRLAADDHRHVYVFRRTLADDQVVVVLNASSSHRTYHLDHHKTGWKAGDVVRNLLGVEEFAVTSEGVLLSLSPWSTMWIG